MTAPVYVCRVQALRERLRLSQVELARRAGLTRQAINIIERGLSVPSVTTALRLAEVLGCNITELFVKQAPPETVTATLVGGEQFSHNRVRLIYISGHWIATPAQAPHTEAFGEADGRLLSRNRSQGQIRLLADPEKLRNNLLVVGCDPALGVLRDLWHRSHDGGAICWQNLPSSEALQALRRGEAHIAGVHFHDAESQRKALESLSMEVLVVHFAQWEQGWMLRQGNPFHFHSPEDLVQPRLRLINRNAGSGSRLLLDALLKKARIFPKQIASYSTLADSHFACAKAILEGRADVAIGLRAVAESCGLDFVPIQEVAFNLVVPKALLDFAPVARLLELLQNSRLHHQLSDLPGYVTTLTGKVLS